MQMSGEVGVFVKQLEARRRQAGLRHSAAAAEVGCSRSVWSRVIRGQRPVSAEFARRVIGRWPEFAAYYAADLAAAGAAGRKEEYAHVDAGVQ